jgi:DNA-binding XRE family transcriptional regulator
VFGGRYKANIEPRFNRPESEAQGRYLDTWVFSSALRFLAKMGHARRRPKRLAEKLLQIRKALGVSQREMVELLGIEMPYKNISKYERNKSTPPSEIVLAYARLARVPMAQIVDDDQDLSLSP